MVERPSAPETDAEIPCPGCGRPAPADTAFCSACGTRLRPDEPIRPSGDLLRGERRPATVALSDLCGYTAMTESCDPEEVAWIMNVIKAEAVRIVEAHGGIVNQFIGDQIVALFGIPTARGDDAQRATAAALKLHEFVRTLAPRVEADIGEAMRMHTGIQSGLVIAELLDRRNGVYGLTGDTVNTAARLLALATPDQILVGDGTMAQVDEYFEARSAGVHTVKGKARGIRTYEVLGPRAEATRFGNGRARGLTPWTGRDQELAALNDALDLAAAGQGRMISVEGDAGAGKSRLCHEFLVTIDRHRAMVYAGRCQSYGSVVPYLPFIEAFRAGLGLRDMESAESVVERTVKVVREIDPALEQYIPLYLQLLSAPSRNHPAPANVSADELSRLIQESAVDLILALSARRPVVLFLDDWHWADEASQATLTALVRRISSHPILVIVARRPGRQSHWDAGPTRTVRLEPFGPEETADIVARCLDVKTVDPPLVARIHGRTQGNPFFVEEICRSLEQTGRVRRDDGGTLVADQDVDDLELPETVQAVLLSRVDDIGPQLRDVLRLASVIGQDFSRRILDRLVPPDWPTESLLADLEALGFVIRQPPEELSDYRFRHVTTQEVTYGTLLRSERARAHEQIATAMESLDHGDQHVEAIARHYRMAGIHAKALEHLDRAAVKATRTSALQEAKHHLYEAVQCSLALGDDEQTVRRRVRLTLRWAQACIFSPSLDQIGMLEAAFDYAQALGDDDLALQTLYWISWIYFSVGEHVLAQRTIERALAGVTDAVPPWLSGLMRMQLGYALVTQRKPDGRAVLGHGLAERQRAAQVSGQPLSDTDGYACAMLALAQADRGDFRTADELLSQGLEIVRAAGRRPAESSVMITSAAVELFRANWKGVIAWAGDAREIAVPLRAPYHLATADALSGYARFRLGEESEGLAEMRRGLEDLENSGAFLTKCLSLACLADALSRSGRFAEAEALATAALDRATAGDVLGDELAHRALLRIEARRSPAAVSDRLAVLRDDSGVRRSPRHAAIADLAAADAAWRMGRHDEAAASALSARDRFGALGIDGDREEAEALLALLEHAGYRRG